MGDSSVSVAFFTGEVAVQHGQSIALRGFIDPADHAFQRIRCVSVLYGSFDVYPPGSSSAVNEEAGQYQWGGIAFIVPSEPKEARKKRAAEGKALKKFKQIMMRIFTGGNDQFALK